MSRVWRFIGAPLGCYHSLFRYFVHKPIGLPGRHLATPRARAVDRNSSMHVKQAVIIRWHGGSYCSIVIGSHGAGRAIVVILRVYLCYRAPFRVDGYPRQDSDGNRPPLKGCALEPQPNMGR